MFFKYGFIIACLFFVFPTTSFAESEDECAIWLCLPGGFPDGCGAAHSAMLDRIKQEKSPLPDFGACSVDSGTGSQMSYDYGKGAWMPEHEKCVKESGGDNSQCLKYKKMPAGFYKNQYCTRDRDGDVYPPGCIKRSYIDVYVDGKPVGDTYYW